MSRSLVSGSGLLAFMLATACTHAVRLRQPTEISASTSQIPIAVNLLIDARLRTYEAHPATYAGAVHHSFDVPIGPALADSLERAVRSVFRDAQVVTTTNGDRPTLSLALNGDPVMNTQWEMGLFLVGLRTDCILTVDARLLSEKGGQVWQTIAIGHGHHETGRLFNWPTAAQAEPAAREAIELVSSDLVRRLTAAHEVGEYESEPHPIAQQPTQPPEPPRTEPSGKRDVAGRLRQLEEMHSKGLITDTEYREKRQRILEDL